MHSIDLNYNLPKCSINTQLHAKIINNISNNCYHRISTYMKIDGATLFLLRQIKYELVQ